MNKKTLLFILTILLIASFFIYPVKKTFATDGTDRTEYRIYQVKENITTLPYLPKAYKDTISLKTNTYVENKETASWDKKLDRLSDLSILVSNYYNRIAAYIQKSYTLVNSAITFINQHNINHADYINGAFYFKEDIYNSEVAPILSDLQTIKNIAIPDYQQTIESNITTTGESISFFDSSEIIDSSINKVDEDIQEKIPELIESFNNSINQITENVSSILNIARDTDKVVNP